MVDVSSQNNSVSINVSSGGNSASIKATPDMTQYYSEKSREWAISNRIVDNTDYSSKYYAEKSKESEAKTKNYERSVIEKYNSFVEVSKQAEAELQTLKDDSISQINTVTSSGISDIANKASEAATEINSYKEAATNEVNNAKNSAVTQLSKEAQEQLKNIESTGFYMRDDKLYFINSKGEEEEFKSGPSAVMFDTKIADHILEGEEAKGWALQGTYVSGALYPDFIERCKKEKSEATATSVTLGSNTLTIYKHSNGHQFYNIADKSKVDSFFATYGIANFYGVDEENERIFLPRNKYFAIKNPASNVPVVGNGKTLGMTNGVETGALVANVPNWGATYPVRGVENTVPQATGTLTNYFQGNLGVTTDSTKSGIIAQTSNVIQPDESKYLYYCVGNTVVNDTEIDAGGLVAQMEQKANIFLDNVLPSSEFKNGVVSWGMPDYENGIICTVSFNVEQTYTAPSNGIITYSLSAYNGGQAYIKINNQQVQWAKAYSNPDFNSITGSLPVSKNDVIKYFSHYSYTDYNTQNIIFYPMKGAN